MPGPSSKGKNMITGPKCNKATIKDAGKVNKDGCGC